jgi:GWxTD domain-containing protein
MRPVIYIFLTLAAIVLVGCRSKNHYTSKPTKSLTNPDTDLLEVNAVAYHYNDSLTYVYLEIINENLLYKRPDTSKAFYSELKISCNMFHEQNSRKIVDSVTYYLYDRAGEEKVSVKPLFSHFALDAKLGNNYHLEIVVADVNRKTQYSKSLNIYKQNRSGAQNFLITRRDTVVFKNSFLKNDDAVVKFNNIAVSQVSIDCFFKEFGPALPPFSTKAPDEFKYKPDSMFVLDLRSNQFALTMPEKGFYHVKANSENNEGLTLFTYDATFPGVSNSDEMINCTRYIMSKDEFDECKNAADKKAAIDRFWLNIGGSNERAHELLRRYYSRVKEANRFFTSYTQGWKTDKGMIFIVFGPPTNTYRSKRDEIWVYGNEVNPNSLRFVFNKTQNPFSDNDFVMERSQFYKDAWHTAVEYWRQGLIYLEGRR